MVALSRMMHVSLCKSTDCDDRRLSILRCPSSVLPSAGVRHVGWPLFGPQGTARAQQPFTLQIQAFTLQISRRSAMPLMPHKKPTSHLLVHNDTCNAGSVAQLELDSRLQAQQGLPDRRGSLGDGAASQGPMQQDTLDAATLPLALGAATQAAIQEQRQAAAALREAPVTAAAAGPAALAGVLAPAQVSAPTSEGPCKGGAGMALVAGVASPAPTRTMPLAPAGMVERAGSVAPALAAGEGVRVGSADAADAAGSTAVAAVGTVVEAGGAAGSEHKHDEAAGGTARPSGGLPVAAVTAEPAPASQPVSSQKWAALFDDVLQGR